MNPSVWLFVGILLLALEVYSTTFVLLFFGAAALVVAGLSYFVGISLAMQLSVFAVAGVLGTALLRSRIRTSFRARGEFRTDETMQLTTRLAPGERATMAYQGSQWTVMNADNVPLEAGTTVAIYAIKGVTIHVKAIVERATSMHG